MDTKALFTQLKAPILIQWDQVENWLTMKHISSRNTVL